MARHSLARNSKLNMKTTKWRLVLLCSLIVSYAIITYIGCSLQQWQHTFAVLMLLDYTTFILALIAFLRPCVNSSH